MDKHISIFENNLHRYLPLFEKDMRRVIIDKLHIPEDVANALHSMSDKYSINLANYLLNRVYVLWGNDSPVKEVKEGRYDKLSGLDKDAWERIIRSEYGDVRESLAYIKDWLSSRINRPNPDEPRDLDLKKLTYDQALDYAGKWHQALQAVTTTRDTKVESERKQAIINFPDGWYWIDLKTNNSEEESKFMGHCGRDSSAQTLLSLRDDKGLPHVTMSYDYAGREKGKLVGGFYRQAKGRNNSKPKPEYHDKIVALFEKLKIAGKRGSSYKPELDFKIGDLDKTKYADFIAKWEELRKANVKGMTLEEVLKQEGVDDTNAEVLANVLEDTVTVDENLTVDVITEYRIEINGDEYTIEYKSDAIDGAEERVYDMYTQEFPNYIEGSFFKYVWKEKDREAILKVLFTMHSQEKPRDTKYENALVEMAIKGNIIPKKALTKSFTSGKLATPFNLTNMLTKYFSSADVKKIIKFYPYAEFPIGFLDTIEEAGLWGNNDTYGTINSILENATIDELMEYARSTDFYVGTYGDYVVMNYY